MIFRGRAALLRLTFLLILTILVARLAWVQIVKADEIIRRGEERQLATKTLLPLRGSILDRQGRTLAVSVPVFAVAASPVQMHDRSQVAQKLAPVIDLSAQEIRQNLERNAKLGYIVLKQNLTQQQAQKIQEMGLDGVWLEQKSLRLYPQETAANQVIGYVASDDGHGEYGLEARYEKELRGEPGYVKAEFTLGETPIEDTVQERVPARPGSNLVLTIDIALQQQIEARLDEVVKSTNAKRALTIAMNAHTGEILVMAMRPGADPGDRRTWLTGGTAPDFGKITNWAVSPLPPGSIFKTITASAALEERVIDLNTPFLDTGEITIDGWRIMNWDQNIPVQPKPMAIADLLANSSNVGMIQVGQKIPRDTFVKYLKGFGFMDTTGLDFSHEESGNFGVTPFEKKYNVDWANMYIGQHLEVTPIQMVTAVAAIANGGYIVRPHLVKEIDDAEGHVVEPVPVGQRRQVISQTTAKEVQQLMTYVVEKGTAVAAKMSEYSAGGKTGTAQKFNAKGEINDRNIADFIGFAPASNPQIVMMILVDEPEGKGYGGVVAAPLFREFMPRVMQAAGIAPDHPTTSKGEKVSAAAAMSPVPDVRWLPVAWANNRLARAGFTVKRRGEGSVVAAQSVVPGTPLRAGATIELSLSSSGPNGGDKLHLPDFTGLSLAEASQLADELSIAIKPSSTGFVVSQQPPAGTLVSAHSTLSLGLAPP